MFEGADIKLQDARTAIQRLSALIKPPFVTNIQIKSGPSGVSGDSVGIDDPFAFSEAFSSCMAQVRSVGDAVLKDKAANKLPGFGKWREEKKDECKNDDLMKFINNRRNDDLHAGDRSLSFTMHPHKFSSESVGVKPIIGATLRINGTGPYWIVDQGTPQERRVRCKCPQGVTYTVAIIDPPNSHKGKSLSSSNPAKVFNLVPFPLTELRA